MRCWTFLLQRYVLGLKDIEAPHASRSEACWFVFYGAASTIYRVIVTTLIALFIAGRFFFIGVVLALWAVFAMAVLPVLKGLRHIINSPRLYRHRTRAIGVSFGTAALIGGFVFLLPFPFRTRRRRWYGCPTQVFGTFRCGTGFLREFLVPPGIPGEGGRCAGAMFQSRGGNRFARCQGTSGRNWKRPWLSETLADRTRGALARARLDQRTA